jgi:hypothetical protein
MSIQEQYGENLRRAQEAWVKAVESWTSSVQNAFSQTSGDNPFLAADPNTFIDQYFDLAQKTLDAQREVAKNMAKASQSMGQALRKQAESGDVGTQG